MKITSVLSAIILCVSLVGCASYIPPSESDPHAKLQGSKPSKQSEVIILEINGQPLVSTGKKMAGLYYEPRAEDVHLIPSGTCTVKTQYIGPPSYVSRLIEYGTATFEAKAGKTYTVVAEVDNKSKDSRVLFGIVEN